MLKNTLPISVLMSVYHKENPEHLRLALQSIADQDCLPAEIVLVEDGVIPENLTAVLNAYEAMLPLVRLKFPENRGLGPSLKDGLSACKYEIVARMDSDDIARSNRLRDQYKYLLDKDLDLIGSYIEEFKDKAGDLGIIRAVRLDHAGIYASLSRRNCFNHMTVMFRKSVVLAAGSYRDEPFFEDYALWLRMRKQGSKFANLPYVHVYARVGNGLMTRRSGLTYIRRELKAFHIFRREGLIGRRDFLFSICIRTAARALPAKVFQKIYSKLLRKRAV